MTDNVDGSGMLPPTTPPTGDPKAAQPVSKFADPEYAAKLEDEAKKRRLENNQLKQQNAELAAQLAGVSELAAQLKQLQTEMAAEREVRRGVEMQALRLSIAQEYRLPEQLAARLQGSTRDELARDAAELAKLVPPQPTTPAPPANPLAARVGNSGSAPPADQIREAVRAKMSAKPNPATNPFFDSSMHVNKGGGIVED